MASPDGYGSDKSPVAAQEMCPKGHRLEDYTIPVTEIAGCDACTKNVAPETHVIICTACNWYVCDDCRSKGEGTTKETPVELISAAAIESCRNDFKDPGVQVYGGPLFQDIRDTADEIFNNLPAPKTSRAPLRPSQASSAPPAEEKKKESELRGISLRWVLPLGGERSGDRFIGRQDGRIKPDGDEDVFFVKARLPAMPGAREKYLLCHIDGFKYTHKEVTPEEVRDLTAVRLGRTISTQSVISAEGHLHRDEIEHNQNRNEAATIEYLFKQCDLNHDGKVTASELRGACAISNIRHMLNHEFPGSDIEAIVKELDKHGEGAISLEEFRPRFMKYQGMKTIGYSLPPPG